MFLLSDLLCVCLHNENHSSVVTILDKAGEGVNSYEYDPFGRVIAASESVRNIFQYVGQLGVIKDEAVENVYMMRARHYDATHGRFMSFDPLGMYVMCTTILHKQAKLT